MIQSWLLSLLLAWVGFAATTSPLRSKLGDSFRTGVVTLDIIETQTTYDFDVPYSTPLSRDPVTLALSLQDYNQTFSDSYNAISYRLLEDIPSPSNSTHAVFRVELGFPQLTYQAKVRFLACPTVIFSSNFYIITEEYSLDTLPPYTYREFDPTIKRVTNTSGSYSSSVWMSGINLVQKLSPGDEFYLEVYFTPAVSSSKFQIYNQGANPMYFGSVRITVIFMNNGYYAISRMPQFPYFLYIYSYKFPAALNRYNSWLDTSNVICGISVIDFMDNEYGYTYLYSGNKIDLKSTLTPTSDFDWTPYTQCIILGPKMCPTTNSFYDSSSDLCYDSCPGQNVDDYLCTPANICPANCQFCSSNTACKSCSYGYFLRPDFQCYASCLPGTYPDAATSICELCPTGCTTCTSATACQSCAQSYYMRSDGLCVSVCPAGSYPQKSNMTCVSCPTGCATCTSLAACQSCSSAYFLRKDGLCYTDCPAGAYPETRNSTCTDCPVGCVTCTSLNICQSCSPSYYSIPNGLCVKECPAGSFPQNSNMTCVSCPVGCETCTSLTACQSCRFYYFMRNDSLCYTSCPAGSYPETKNRTCSSCPVGCSICTSLSVCQSCSPSFFLMPGGLCYSSCPPGYYADSSTLSCTECAVGCATCSSSTVCSSCRSPYELVNSSCSYPESSNTLLVVGLGVAGGLLVVSVGVIIWCKMKRKRYPGGNGDIISDPTTGMLSENRY